MPALAEKQNITLSLTREALQKARVLAAKRSMSLSGFLTSQLEQLANSEDEYDQAMKGAIELFDHALPLGGSHKIDRDSLHER